MTNWRRHNLWRCTPARMRLKLWRCVKHVHLSVLLVVCHSSVSCICLGVLSQVRGCLSMTTEHSDCWQQACYNRWTGSADTAWASTSQCEGWQQECDCSI